MPRSHEDAFADGRYRSRDIRLPQHDLADSNRWIQPGMGMNLMVVVVAGIALLPALAFRRRPPPSSSIDPSVIPAFRKTYRQPCAMAIPTAAFLVWVLKDPSSGGALDELLLLVAVALVAWVCVYTCRHWRCPKCGAYLGRNPLYTGQRPNCDTALREPRGSSR